MYYISLSSLLSEHRVLQFSLNYSWSTNYSKLSNILFYHFSFYLNKTSQGMQRIWSLCIYLSVYLYIYLYIYLSIWSIHLLTYISIYLSTFYLECWLVCDESIWIMSLIHQSLYKHVLGFQPNLITWISVIRLKAKKNCFIFHDDSWFLKLVFFHLSIYKSYFFHNFKT